ncbi:MAG: YigZ family protein [Porphyromonas sp.]|nr:YigZ family protein [Porphyromonas sp.]
MEEQTQTHSYRTLEQPSEGLYVEKRSKFLSFAIPVDSEEKALAEVEEIRRRYYDARHVCWAYRIGKREKVERDNDDGEPSSTAGKPILGQLHSHDLTDLVIAVVRYFGGVKLGTGGLIVAYRSAAEQAILNGKVVEHQLFTEYQLRFPYELINPLMMLLRAHDAETLRSDSNLEGYVWYVKVPDSRVGAFEEASDALYQLQYTREGEEG